MTAPAVRPHARIEEFTKKRVLPFTDKFVRPGRYRISTLKASDIMGTFPSGWAGLNSPEDTNRLSCTLDGTSVTNQVVRLSAGSHELRTAGDSESAVVWMGPRLDRIHRVSQNDHLRLFINWY